jgi:hypothetical protein
LNFSISTSVIGPILLTVSREVPLDGFLVAHPRQIVSHPLFFSVAANVRNIFSAISSLNRILASKRTSHFLAAFSFRAMYCSACFVFPRTR